VAELVYVALKGGEPPGEERVIGYDDGDADTLADRALGKLRTLVQRFERDEQPYLPLVMSMWKSRYGTYDHLARVKEWSVGGDEEEGGGGGE
jgi:ATP-dependent helicase/nuclease subunit B